MINIIIKIHLKSYFILYLFYKKENLKLNIKTRKTRKESSKQINNEYYSYNINSISAKCN